MSRRWIAVVLAAAIAAAGLLAGRAYRHSDVRGSATVEFVTTDVPKPAPRTTRSVQGVAWPTYRFDGRRLGAVEGTGLVPPFRRIWTFRARALLEFPPAVAYGRLYLPTFDGRFYALDAATGRVDWRYTSYRCSWASPAVWRRLVFATFLSRGPDCEHKDFRPVGEVIAFDADSGRVVWRRRTAVTESSPLVAGGLVYVGDWSGRITALAARSGRVRWIFRAGGEIKGSPAIANGRLVVGAYDGQVYALAARTGKLLWRSGSQARLGGRGRFYSSPALAYGRAFIGSTDGKVYAFGAASGRLLWARSTGGYVYASPAVWRGLILLGSYDHSFYALEAATGETRWRFRANGPISGSASVVDGVVYFSTLAQRTYGLDARTGRPVWQFPDGKYSPVVADHERLYLVGWGRLYGLAAR